MPCNDYPSGSTYYQAESNRAKQKADRLTRMLCSLCREVDSHNNDPSVMTVVFMPNNVKDWWKEHKEADRKRQEAAKIEADKLRKKKKLRRSGLSKLTDEERKALGLQERRQRG